MVCCPCSNCWGKTPSSQDALEPPSLAKARVQLSVPSQRYIIDEELPTEDTFDDLMVRPIPVSKKRLQMRDGNHSHNKNRLFLAGGRKPTDGTRKQTVLSDWGDAYDGYDSFRLSNNTNTHSQFTEEWTCLSDGTRTSNIPTITAKMNLLPGNVLVMQLTKGDPIFRVIKLESTLNELVDSFLSANSGGVKLPVSFTESEHQRPKLMKKNRMAMSIQDNLGCNLDVSTQGLTFSIGPLNAKLCYKMSVVDLGQLEKIFSLTQENNLGNVMGEDL